MIISCFGHSRCSISDLSEQEIISTIENVAGNNYVNF